MINNEKQKLEANIWKFYLFDIFEAMLFAVPIIVLFWQENGLSLTQIMILQSLFAIAIVLLELPTGYFADMYGRKNILLLSGISFVIAISIYSIGFSFAAFLLAELFFALALSLYSGTSSAFVYDTLKQLKRENEYKKIFGKAKYYGFIAMAFSQIIGGFVGKINFRWTFYLTIPFYLLTVFITISMHEPKRNKLIVEKNNFKNHLRKLIKILKYSLINNIKMRWLIIFSAIIYAVNSAGLWLYQPYFKLTGIDIAYFGIIFASFQIVSAISSKYAHKIENKLGMKTSLIILIPIIFIGYLLTSKIIFLFSFVFIYFFQFVRAFSDPIFSDYINKLTTSDIRATVLSVQSLARRLLYAILIPFIGWIADVYSLVQAFAVAGIVTAVIGVIVLFMLYKDDVI
ncbi:MFS transporter [Candidatus Woesearchaeota archaeon]|nr:MFS transporter [Candidatus Woesearchaeota archaeon]